MWRHLQSKWGCLVQTRWSQNVSTYSLNMRIQIETGFLKLFRRWLVYNLQRLRKNTSNQGQVRALLKASKLYSASNSWSMMYALMVETHQDLTLKHPSHVWKLPRPRKNIYIYILLHIYIHKLCTFWAPPQVLDISYISKNLGLNFTVRERQHATSHFLGKSCNSKVFQVAQEKTFLLHWFTSIFTAWG